MPVKQLQKLGSYALSLTQKHTPWTNVYGLARSFLAFGTLLTLLFNHSSVIFRPAAGVADFPMCRGASTLGLFCISSPYLEIARWISIAILLVVISGWRPRLTGILHWWVAFSLQTSGTLLEGGDQATAVLTLLLLPVTLLDNRKWHWATPDADSEGTLSQTLKKLFAISAMGAIRLQVAMIYFHAAVAKMFLEEWIDGTILYYWLNDPMLGLPNWQRFMLPIFSTRLVVIFTWGTLIVETLLFMGLLMPKKYWRPLLVAGITFHAGIAFMMGLVSFGCAMTAALILYLQPFDQPFDFKAITKFFTLKLKPKGEKVHIPNDSALVPEV